MRILLAVDGSESSNRALELVSTLPLPAASPVRVIAVVEPGAAMASLDWIAPSTAGDLDLEEPTRKAMHDAVEHAERVLDHPERVLEGFVLTGRAATAIVDEAREFRADLVVVGSRGHGSIATMLLGSTAAEVADHAPCPVLVGRAATLGPIALADDGSAAARVAEQFLAASPIAAGRPVTVVSVAEVGLPMSTGFMPGLYDQVLASYTEAVESARADRLGLASEVAGRLTAAGVAAAPVVLEGDAAAELIRYAAEGRAGTIVIGSRGHTGLARLFLGSVARNVLVHAPCSVLVVREHGYHAGETA